MTRRKPLEWYDTDMGTVPDCDDCLGLLLDPVFQGAVYSVAIEHPGQPVDLARRAVDAYHVGGHVER